MRLTSLDLGTLLYIYIYSLGLIEPILTLEPLHHHNHCRPRYNRIEDATLLLPVAFQQSRLLIQTNNQVKFHPLGAVSLFHPELTR